jgi:predicted nuclease with TOPRIM domain
MRGIDERAIWSDLALTKMAIALDTLAYARRLREVGFSAEQAEGQAEALAAAMSDTLATKQDLQEMDARIDARFAKFDTRFAQVDARFAQVDARFDRIDDRFEYLEKHMDTRFIELEKRFELRLDTRLADLERRMTMRLGGVTVAAVSVVSVLVKLL